MWRIASAQGVALAGANVNSGGTVETQFNRTGSTLSVSTSRGTGQYEITIAGVTYSFFGFVTIVTPVADVDGTCATDSISGHLLVQCYDQTGALANTGFSFEALQ
jgi:hypothetical protein